MFGAASGSEFGVASSGGFGGHKNVFTFTLDQGAQPVSLTAEDWSGLEHLEPQFLETDSQLLQLLPEVTTSEQKTDEGYESAHSPKSNHSLEANSDTFIVEDFSNLDKFDFNLILDNTLDEQNDFHIIETSNPLGCAAPEPLALYNEACFPMEDQDDPDWGPGLTLQKIGVIDDPFLHDVIMNGTGVKGKAPAGGIKHRRGQIRMKSDEIKDETHKKNVDRCRDYRVAKKAKDGYQLTELEQLEEENIRLTEQEKEMREKLEKSKKIYIDLITTGKIKFV